MSLDQHLHVIYGYRIEGRKILDKFDNAIEENQIDDEDYLYELSNADDGELIYIEDSMCGKYEYIGIKIYSKYIDYGSDYHLGFNPGKLVQYYNDKKLDSEIQSKLPFLGDLYDPAGLMDDELPRLWIAVTVS